MIYGKYLERTKGIKHIYTIILIVISFTIFNSESLSEVGNNLSNMFLINKISTINFETIYHIRNYCGVIIIAIFSATPLFQKLSTRFKKCKLYSMFLDIYYIGLLIVTTAFLIDSSFNPFLYFRF